MASKFRIGIYKYFRGDGYDSCVQINNGANKKTLTKMNFINLSNVDPAGHDPATLPTYGRDALTNLGR